jgi:hypothetical protein
MRIHKRIVTLPSSGVLFRGRAFLSHRPNAQRLLCHATKTMANRVVMAADAAVAVREPPPPLDYTKCPDRGENRWTALSIAIMAIVVMASLILTAVQ